MIKITSLFSFLQFSATRYFAMNCDLTYKSIMVQNKVDKIEWVQHCASPISDEIRTRYYGRTK